MPELWGEDGQAVSEVSMAAPVPQAALESSSGACLQVYAGGQLPLPSMGRAAFICGKDLVSVHMVLCPTPLCAPVDPQVMRESQQSKSCDFAVTIIGSGKESSRDVAGSGRWRKLGHVEGL